MNPVIRIEGLSKRYLIDHQPRERYVALRDVLANAARSLGRRLAGAGHNTNRHAAETMTREEFWALDDVSFEVQPGEAVGIIGRNGAGKSTLLKILSRITEPTSGRVTIDGRLASLLEVGTGFHPELTGRENIYMNGAILGMRREEIRQKFDEIVAFAEVERFLDTPVKRYSSGMYVRLAFAVAAHLEPEILVIDEVLAVGDAEFQKKCLGKMSEVAHGGRTVLFVSHNMAAIEALTQRCALLVGGRLKHYAPTRDTVAAYLSLPDSACETGDLRTWPNRSGSGGARLVKFRTCTTDGVESSTVRPLQTFDVFVTIEFAEVLRADIAVVVENAKEQALFTTHLSDSRQVEKLSGEQTFRFRLDPNLLRCGEYKVSISVFSPDMLTFFDTVFHFPGFEVAGHPESGAVPMDARWGDLYLQFDWKRST